MSTYIHFFVRKHDNFAPIGTYGRSTWVFHAFESIAPWEKITVLGYKELGAAKASLSLDSVNAEIENAKARIAQVSSFNNSIEDKLAAVNAIEDEISEMRETVEEIKNARAFIGFLYDILDEAEFCPLDGVEGNAYLYIGMECGKNVTTKDILAKKI